MNNEYNTVPGTYYTLNFYWKARANQFFPDIFFQRDKIATGNPKTIPVNIPFGAV